MTMIHLYITLCAFVFGLLIGVYFKDLWLRVFTDKYQKQNLYIRFLQFEIYYWGQKYSDLKKKDKAKTANERELYGSLDTSRLSTNVPGSKEFLYYTYGPDCLEIDFED